LYKESVTFELFLINIIFCKNDIYLQINGFFFLYISLVYNVWWIERHKCSLAYCLTFFYSEQTREIQERSEGKKVEQFNALSEQYAPMISAIIRKLHIYRDYEVYRQAGRVALWQAAERYDESKGHFTPFAYRTIYGALLDELKRESRFAANVTVMENENFEWIVDPGCSEEMPDWLDDVSLSQKERALLKSLFIEGNSVSDLAALHQISQSGMKKRRERVLKKVKVQLQEEKWIFSKSIGAGD